MLGRGRVLKMHFLRDRNGAGTSWLSNRPDGNQVCEIRIVLDFAVL